MENKLVLQAQLEGNELNIRQGNAKPIYNRPPVSYVALTVPSLIDLIEKKAVKENCIIGCSDEAIEVILDDTVHDRDQDRLYYHYPYSIMFQEWVDIIGGKTFTQKEFLQFLKRCDPETIVDYETLYANIQNFKYVTHVSGDFKRDEKGNYSFAIVVNNVESTLELNSILQIKLEIYRESSYLSLMEFELEIEKPKNENDKLTFTLSCPKIKRYVKDARDNLRNMLEANLPDYLIVSGII